MGGVDQAGLYVEEVAFGGGGEEREGTQGPRSSDVHVIKASTTRAATFGTFEK